MNKQFKLEVSGRDIIIKTGGIARQANGAVLIQHGDTVVLVTAVAERERNKDSSFFPFICNYQEKTYAAGKIPGGFFKREGKPTEKDTLTSRLIDRPLRPFFEEHYENDTQVIVTVLSVDQENDPDIIAIIGASAALIISDIPLKEPIGAVRVGRIDNQFICNPTYAQREVSDMDIVVAGSEHSILMVEGSAKVVPELEMLDAIMFAHEHIKPIVRFQNEIKKEIGIKKMDYETVIISEDMIKKVFEYAGADLQNTLNIASKQERYRAQDNVKSAVLKKLSEEFSEESKSLIGRLFITVLGFTSCLVSSNPFNFFLYFLNHFRIKHTIRGINIKT